MLSFYHPFVVGRHPQAGLVLTAKTASRIHAFLCHDGQSWNVADLGSQYGTYRNGVRILQEMVGPLRLGDLIQFGKQAFLVQASKRLNANELLPGANLRQCTVKFLHAVTLYRADPTLQEIVSSRTFNPGEVWDGLNTFGCQLVNHPVDWFFCTEAEDGWYFGPLSSSHIAPAHQYPNEGAAQSCEVGTPFIGARTGYTFHGPGWLRFHRSTWSRNDPVKIQAGEVRWVSDSLHINSPVAIEPLGDDSVSPAIDYVA